MGSESYAVLPVANGDATAAAGSLAQAMGAAGEGPLAGVVRIMALKRANAHHAYGAAYVQNILHQEKHPKKIHPPVHLKREDLNRIRLEEPLLAEYDALILKRKE
jgi:hypothetical protein